MNVRSPKRRSHVTVVARLATSLVIAPTRLLPEVLAGLEAVVVADTLVEVAKSAINAVRWDTSHETVPKEVLEAMAEGTKVAAADMVEAMAAVVAEVEVVRHASPAGDTDTCRETVLRVKSATTVNSST